MRRSIVLAVATLAAVLAIPLAPAAAATGTAAAVADRPVRPVPALDLERYQGLWRQLAAIPQPFEAECARDVQAVYAALPDGLIRVQNSCVRADGTTAAIEGRARVTGPSTAQLTVTFVQLGGVWQFQPPFGADYWVIGLSPDYRWAVVGGPERRGGFVLARTPALLARDVAAIVAVLLRNGYDPCDFVLTPTTGGLPVPLRCP